MNSPVRDLSQVLEYLKSQLLLRRARLPFDHQLQATGGPSRTAILQCTSTLSSLHESRAFLLMGCPFSDAELRRAVETRAATAALV